jgi:hypothetical protein
MNLFHWFIVCICLLVIILGYFRKLPEWAYFDTGKGHK